MGLVMTKKTGKGVVVRGWWEGWSLGKDSENSQQHKDARDGKSGEHKEGVLVDETKWKGSAPWSKKLGVKLDLLDHFGWTRIFEFALLLLT